MLGDRTTAYILFLYTLTGFFVFIEPAPTDLIFVVLLLLLPFYKKAYIIREVFVYTSIISFITLVLFFFVDNKQALLSFGALTIYLLLTVLIVSTYIAKSNRNLKYLWNGYVWSAIISACLILLIQIGVLPWKEVIFYGDYRLEGFFKDPNVFGPYMVAPTIYMIGRSLSGKKRALSIITVSVFLILIFQAGSRGAWLNLFVSLVVFFILFDRKYSKRVYYFIPIVAIVLILIQLSSFEFNSILEQRTELQAYDYTRFSNWYEAFGTFLVKPLGVGAGQSISKLGMAPHNVYLILLADYGLIGFIIWGAFGIHTLCGYKNPSDKTNNLIYITAYASLIGILANSFFIDSTHWRQL